jgi:hypothetical protein
LGKEGAILAERSWSSLPARNPLWHLVGGVWDPSQQNPLHDNFSLQNFEALAQIVARLVIEIESEHVALSQSMSEGI